MYTLVYTPVVCHHVPMTKPGPVDPDEEKRQLDELAIQLDGMSRPEVWEFAGKIGAEYGAARRVCEHLSPRLQLVIVELHRRGVNPGNILTAVHSSVGRTWVDKVVRRAQADQSSGEEGPSD